MWPTCMESSLLSKDLREVIGSSEAQPLEGDAAAMEKWRIKTGNAMFPIKTIVEVELLENIRKALQLVDYNFV